MLLVWQNGLMHHWRPFGKVYRPDGVTDSELCSVISRVLHLSSPLIDTSLPFIALLRASFVERVSLLPKFCIETRVTVLKPALTVWCHKSWPIDGYCESLHFASPAISAHVPVSLLDIRAWARGCLKKKPKGVISTPEGLLKAFRRPSEGLQKAYTARRQNDSLAASFKITALKSNGWGPRFSVVKQKPLCCAWATRLTPIQKKRWGNLMNYDLQSTPNLFIDYIAITFSM